MGLPARRGAIGAVWCSVLLFWSAAARADLPAVSYNPTYTDTVRLLVAAAKECRHISVATIGNSAAGRQIPVALLYDPAISPLEMTRVLIVCRQHGNEPAPTLAMLSLIRDVALNRSGLRAQLQRVCLIIVPMLNPDGVEANERQTGASADLNRDWAGRSQPETQAVERLFDLWRPQVVLDLHELHWRDRHGVNTVEAPEAGAVAAPLQSEAQALQALVLGRLQAAGFPVRVSLWDGNAHPGLCHRHFARDHGRVALLFESERQNFQTPLSRRAQMHRIGVQTVVDYYYSRGYARQGPRVAMAPLGALPSPVVSDAPPPAFGVAPRVLGPAAARPTTPVVELLSPTGKDPISGRITVQARVEGIADLNYVTVLIDKQGRFYANQPPYSFDLDTTQLAPGAHAILVQARRKDGSMIEREYLINVAAR